MKKILIAVDSVKDSKRVSSLFDHLVWLPEQIILLHVEQLEGNSLMTAMLGDAEISTLKESLKDTEHKKALDKRAEKILTHYKKIMENQGVVNIKTMVRDGNPSAEILKVAEEEDVDLIVVGCSGKSRLHRFITGCASRDVERDAKIPVLVLKGQYDGCGYHDAQIWTRREVYAME